MLAKNDSDNGRLDAPERPSRATLALKRGFDIVVSAMALMVLSPLFAVVALAIRSDSPGPVFFRQCRVGQGGEMFRIFKFRTMIDDAAGAGAALTLKADPRITRLGVFLRNWKIDELPQLINVLQGSMSIVGPRPEVPVYIDLYSERQRRIILSMRPGITDYASIFFRDESKLLDGESDPDSVYQQRIMPIKYALYERYSREISVMNDLRLIFATLTLLYSSKKVDWLNTENYLTTAIAPQQARDKTTEGKPVEVAR